MMYATIEDISKRKHIDTSKIDQYNALLEDAAIIIDAFNSRASEDTKKLISCNMVIRAIGSSEEGVPLGTTQATVSALGYSQSWTNSNGSGELYLTKLEKKLLGSGNRIGFSNPYSELEMEEQND
nr:MAG TPA: hypothetical protein [Caudoviricetes sp.]